MTAGEANERTSLTAQLLDEFFPFASPLDELPDPTPAEGPDPYGDPDPEWLRIDWREGASHFEHWLVDADLANNSGNWQWVAGTGADTRPDRRLSPDRQLKRFDPELKYVRRHLGDIDSSRLWGDSPRLS